MVLLPAPAGPSMAIISLRWDGSVIVGMCDSTRLKRGTLQVAWHAWRGARENSNAWPSTRIGACQERCQTSLGLDARGRPFPHAPSPHQPSLYGLFSSRAPGGDSWGRIPASAALPAAATCSRHAQ